MAELVNPSPSTYLIKTVRGQKRTVIYYDPDIFTENITISASLLLGGEDIPYETHYNTVMDEDTGTAGTAWQALEDIAITLCPVPEPTRIMNERNIKLNLSYPIYIARNYDKDDLFTYNWSVTGDAYFTESTSGTLPDGGKDVEVFFPTEEVVVITCEITNTCGCSRVIEKTLIPGKFNNLFLVLRNSYK